MKTNTQPKPTTATAPQTGNPKAPVKTKAPTNSPVTTTTTETPKAKGRAKVELTSEQKAKMTALTKDDTSTSAKIRTLMKAKYSRGEVARFLNVIYQFVNNVYARMVQQEADAAEKAKATPAASKSTKTAS